VDKGPDRIFSNLLKDDPALAALIEQFIEALPGLVEDFVSAIAQQDWIKLRQLAHDMKGIGGGYGYPLLSELAERIELRLHDEQFDELDSDLQDMRTLAQRIIDGYQN